MLLVKGKERERGVPKPQLRPLWKEKERWVKLQLRHQSKDKERWVKLPLRHLSRDRERWVRLPLRHLRLEKDQKRMKMSMMKMFLA